MVSSCRIISSTNQVARPSPVKISVPPGQATLDVSISGGSGDADLYVRQGALPTLARWDGRPYLWGNNEAVRMRNYPPGPDALALAAATVEAPGDVTPELVESL